jgi:hypothetical protein
MTEETQPQIHTRSLLTEWTVSEGQTVSGRIFPFGQRTHIVEVVDGEIVEYDEEFLPGCTMRMRQAAERRGNWGWLHFTMDHRQGFDGHVGCATGLEEADDGTHASFHLYDGIELPKVRDMLSTSHNGMSIEFIDVAQPIIEGTLHQRRQIHLRAVTATPIPAYESARVLSIRADDADLSATPNLDATRAWLATTGENHADELDVELNGS